MLLEEAEHVGELDPALAAALLFAANLPVFRLEGAAAVELTERAWRLRRSRGPRCRPSGALRARQDDGGRRDRPCPARRARAGPRRTWRPGTRWAPRSVGRSSGWRYEVARTLLTWAVGVQHRGSRCGLPRSLIELSELDFGSAAGCPLARGVRSDRVVRETAQRTGSVAQATIARMEAALGRDEECRRRAQAGFAADAASGLLLRACWRALRLGLLELGRGDPDAAIVALEPCRANRRGGKLR